MTKDEVVAAVRHFHDVRKTNDAAAVRALFVHDPSFEIPGEPGEGSIAIKAEGCVAFDEIAETFTALWHWMAVDFLDIVVDGQVAAVRYSLTVRAAPTGHEFTNEVFDLMEFEDGKVKRLVQYVDTKRIAAIAAAAMSVS